MADTFRLTLAQLNPVVGDLAGNIAQARQAHAAGAREGADLVALPEMFATGYQTMDLGRKPAFVEDVMARIEALAHDLANGPALGIGAPYVEGTNLYNAYWILDGGKVTAVVKKQALPNDSVFDEKRVYHPAEPQGPVAIRGWRIGIPICEDA